jgi:hypothetical protein
VKHSDCPSVISVATSYRIHFFVICLTALLYHPRVLAKGNELAWSALHRFLIRTARCREVGRKCNHFLNVPIPVVPTLDLEGKTISLAGAHFLMENI